MSIKPYSFYYAIINYGLCMCTISLGSDTTINIQNQSNKQLYAATYNSSGRRLGSPVTVPPLGSTSAKRPVSSFFNTTKYGLIGALSLEQLGEQITSPAYAMSIIDSGKTPGTNKTNTILLQMVGNEIGASAAERSNAITIINTTEKVLALALYYDDGKKARRWGEALLIAPEEKINIQRPERKCKTITASICTAYYDRNIYISEDESKLAETISSKSMNFFNIGSAKGTSFYLYLKDDGSVGGAFDTEWKARSTYQTASNLLKPDIDKVKKKFDAMSYPGKNQTATVRRGPELSKQEAAFRKKRMENAIRPICKKLFKEKYNRDLPDSAPIPTIGLCVSGGGCRAMLTLAGFLAAAEEAGFLPYLTYIATLSGSTWGLAGWLQSGLPAQEYRRKLCGELRSGIQLSFNIDQVQEAVLRKKAFNQPSSFIDIYGALLADKLLKPFAPKNNPNNLFWGTPQAAVDEARVPYPIYTSVTPKQFSDLEVAKDPVNYYHWLVFDSYEVSILDLNASIPNWALGRTFKDGTSQDMIPPLAMGYCLGIFGSAMSVNPRDVTKLVVGALAPELAEDIIRLVAKNKTLDLLVQQRASPAKLPNFVEGGLMTLVDAGISLIFPFPPLLKPERTVDMIISVDGSAGIKLAPGIRGAKHFAKSHNLPFPDVDVNDIGKKPYTIAKDLKNPVGPILIHLPMIGHKDYHNGWDPEDIKNIWSNTFNFMYSEAQAELLSGLGGHIFKKAQDAIIQTIAEWLENHTEAETIAPEVAAPEAPATPFDRLQAQ